MGLMLNLDLKSRFGVVFGVGTNFLQNLIFKFNSLRCNGNGPRNPGNPNNPGNNRCCPSGGIWGSWKVKTACTDTCGFFGTQTVERTCLTQSTCGPCSGTSTKTVKCNPTPCQYPRDSCDKGMSAKAVGNQILCTDPNQVPEEAVKKANCCPAGGIMETTDWSSCNGAQTRKKTCASKPYGCDCTEQEQVETQPCQTAPCKFPQQNC